MSEHGRLIDALLTQTHWVVGGVLAVALVLTLWLTLGARLPRPPAPGRWFVVAMAAIVLFVVDGSLLVGSRRARDLALDVAAAEATPGALRVEVNARRWAWDFRLAGADGRFATAADASADDVVTTNELVVPVGQPVILAIGAMDVVHALSVPALAVQAEAIPGRLAHTWFRAERAGVYPLGCAQHCGPAHHRMTGVVRVLAPAEFSAWARAQGKLAELAFDAEDVEARWGWRWLRR